MFISIRILVQIVFWSKSTLSNSFLLHHLHHQAMKTGTIKHDIGFKQTLFQHSLPTPNPHNLHNHWSLPFLCSGSLLFKYVTGFLISLKTSLLMSSGRRWGSMLAVLAPGKRNRCQDLLQAHVFLLQITQYREDRRIEGQTLLHNHHHHSLLWLGLQLPNQRGMLMSCIWE